MNYIFPLGFLSNSMAMTGLMIILVMIGESSLAADVGIVQAITLALFHSFSANARSLIFSNTSSAGAYSIMAVRIALLLPLSVIAYWLSLNTANIDSLVAAALIFRRGMEWLSEVHACEIERKHQLVFAWCYLAAQIGTFIAVVALILVGQPPWIGFFIWGTVPVVLGVPLAIKSLSAMSSPKKWVPKSMLPHFGSSAINGVAVYVLRLLLLASVGKILGGELFAAFAVGGVIGSVFANILGPSVVMHEQRAGKRSSENAVGRFLYVQAISGAVVAGAAVLGVIPNGEYGKSTIFWLAVGLSMVGGAVMVHAQRIRLDLIQQHGAERDVFGPDVLMNILIVAAIPFLAYFGGVKYLAALYLLSSILAFLFYASAMRGERGEVQTKNATARRVKAGVVVLLLVPVFFQWSEWIFQSKQLTFDSGGVLASLPIPIGVIACYAGILVIGTYSRAYVSLTMIFSVFVLMVLTSLSTFDGDQEQNQSKLILLIQFVLPMFALVFGQMYEEGVKSQEREIGLARIFFFSSLLIMSIHLLASWVQSSFILVPNLYFFSIYQYLEYVPVVIVSAVLIGYFSEANFEKNKCLTITSAIVLGLYIGASVSPIFVFMFVAAFFFVSWLRGETEGRSLIIFILGATVAGSYIYIGLRADMGGGQGYQFFFYRLEVTWTDIKEAWAYHFRGATSTPQAMLLGHLERPPRSEYPSAYNYYLGLVYNFGFIAVLPLILGIVYTAISAFRMRETFLGGPRVLAFSATLAYLLLIQNSVSVAMQQPYPAMFIFFIWGVYLSRITAEAPVTQELLPR